jgi:hypothetical protein
MNRSFAQFSSSTTRRVSLACGAALVACASLPPPTSELARAQQAVSRANDADADQYADAAVALARSELSQAQAAMASGRNEDGAQRARSPLSADAEFALATSNAARPRAEFAQDRNEILDLNNRLQLQADVPERSLLDMPPSPRPRRGCRAAASGTLAGAGSRSAPERLRRLRTPARAPGDRRLGRDPRQGPGAGLAYRGTSRCHRRDRRAHEATRRQIEQLHVSVASCWSKPAPGGRAGAAGAERLRVQAQIQAEERQRLREQADTEAAARQQAEDVIIDVGADEAAKLKAAVPGSGVGAQEAALLPARKGLPHQGQHGRDRKIEAFDQAGEEKT